MEIGLTWQQVYGLLKFSQCAIHVAFFGKRSAEVIIGIRIFWVELYRMFIFCNSLFQTAFFIINSAQIVMDVYLRRVIFNGVLVSLQSEVVLHPCLVNVTQVVICIGILGI